MKVFLWNSRSLVNKLVNFQTFVYSSSYHIFAVTETWLSSFILNGELIPTGFTIYRQDRNSRGGGVMLVVRNSLPSRQLPSPPHLEVLSVELSVSLPVIISVVYIPPSSNPDYFSEILQYLASIASHPRSVIVGDFNLPDISWSTLTGHSPFSNALCDLAFRHNLLQLVDFPTHSKGNTLDLVFANSENLVFNLVPSSSDTLCSDHSILSFNLSTTCSQNTSKACDSPTYDFKKTDFDGLLSFLLDVDFDPLLNSSDIELIWSNLKELILYSISLHTPQHQDQLAKDWSPLLKQLLGIFCSPPKL